MKVAKAQNRIRATKGSSYLTHGADDYDHKGLNKARRALDKALINEQLTDTKEGTTQPKDGEYRIVIITGIRENYGAHCWDGEGTCPQYWKNKGGEEYHVHLGSSNQLLQLGGKGIAAKVQQAADKIQRNDDYWQEWIIDWAIIPYNTLTQGEQDAKEAEKDGYKYDPIARLELN